MQATLIWRDPDVMDHPIHLHGYKLEVLDVRRSVRDHDCTLFKCKLNQAFSSESEIRRLHSIPHGRSVIKDTFILPAGGAVATRFSHVTGEPGVWLGHCHMNIHREDGMASLLLSVCHGSGIWSTFAKSCALPSLCLCQVWPSYSMSEIVQQHPMTAGFRWTIPTATTTIPWHHVITIPHAVATMTRIHSLVSDWTRHSNTSAAKIIFACIRRHRRSRLAHQSIRVASTLMKRTTFQVGPLV